MLTWKPEEISIDRSEILRYLAFDTSIGNVSPRSIKILEEEEARARNLISPRGIYRISEAAIPDEIPYLAGAGMIAAGVATIGEGVEKKVKELFKTGDSLRAMFLDAVGTVAVMSVVQLINREICRDTVPRGYYPGRPFSPGYNNWGLDGHKLIFRLLNETVTSMLPVTLTDSLMLIPLKSLSFVIKLSTHNMEDLSGSYCRECALKESCIYHVPVP